jgi:hypothetical protein
MLQAAVWERGTELDQGSITQRLCELCVCVAGYILVLTKKCFTSVV